MVKVSVNEDYDNAYHDGYSQGRLNTRQKTLKEVLEWLIENQIVIKDFNDYFTADDGANITDLIENKFKN